MNDFTVHQYIFYVYEYTYASHESFYVISFTQDTITPFRKSGYQCKHTTQHGQRESSIVVIAVRCQETSP